MATGSAVLLNRLLAKVRMRHLHALVKLADLGTVHRAAAALGMSQPAVSLLLNDLERLIEAPLFVRHARGVSPTPLALDLLPLVRQVLTRLSEGADLVANRLERDEGTVRVLATAAGANGLLAQALPGFAAAHPRVQVVVTEVDIPAIGPSLDTGAADVVFCRQPTVLPQGWAFEACLDDRFVVACGLNHPLARRKRVQFDDLRNATWLPNTAGSAARDRHEALMAEHGWLPRHCRIVTRMSALTWTLLDAQPVLTLVPYSVLRPWVERGQLAVLALPLALPFEPLGMLLPENDRTTACELLAGFVRTRAVGAGGKPRPACDHR